MPLEQNLYSELKIASSTTIPAIARNFSESAARGDVCTRVAVLWCVGGVERFCAQLEFNSLADIDVLEQGEIKIVEAGAVEYVDAGISESQWRRRSETGRIEPISSAPDPLRETKGSNLIDSLCGAWEIETGGGRGQCERQAGRQRE